MTTCKPLNRKLVVETLRRWVGRDADRTAPAEATEKVVAAAKADSPPASDTVLDEETLKDLAEVMGDELGDLIKVYLQDSPARVKEIGEAAATRDAKPMFELAHTLKSTSANLGATRLTEICRQIEEAAKADEVKEAVDAASNLSEAYEEVAKALEAFSA